MNQPTIINPPPALLAYPWLVLSLLLLISPIFVRLLFQFFLFFCGFFLFYVCPSDFKKMASQKLRFPYANPIKQIQNISSKDTPLDSHPLQL